jgi:hypothetical protein
MGVRAELASALRVGTDLPVYDAIHDGVDVPSIVLYPDSRLLDRDAESWGDLVWHHVATILVTRNDLPGAFDRTEAEILNVTTAPLPEGSAWRAAGNYRTESIAGIDYVAVDVYLDSHRPKVR